MASPAMANNSFCLDGHQLPAAARAHDALVGAAAAHRRAREAAAAEGDQRGVALGQEGEHDPLEPPLGQRAAHEARQLPPESLRLLLLL